LCGGSIPLAVSGAVLSRLSFGFEFFSAAGKSAALFLEGFSLTLYIDIENGRSTHFRMGTFFKKEVPI
jgi:hypothetical protein